MNRVLILASVVAASLVATDASAVGRLRGRGACGCSQAAAAAVYAAPQSLVPCCGGAAPGGIPGMVMPAAPVAPGGHQHHSAAPADTAPTALISSDTPPATEKAEVKEVTLTGTLVCAKCGLKEAGVKKCTNALLVKEGNKTVTYYLADAGNGEDYHEGLCGGGKKEGAKVVGTVTEKGGKKWVKATKVEEKQ